MAHPLRARRRRRTCTRGQRPRPSLDRAGPYRVLRHVPTLPYTKEVEAFRRLKRQLAAYRVVFGQPRQEELVTLLAMGHVDDQALRTWAIDLQPPFPEAPTAGKEDR